MSPELSPPIDPVAAQRWQFLPVQSSPWLHEEVGRRMQQRLDCIKSTPAHWVHWQPWRGGWQTQALLAQRYANAQCSVFESSQQAQALVRQALHAPWWQASQWFKSQTSVSSRLDKPAQMLWSNMDLHMAPDPQALLRQWHEALEVDGFLMFSCLGPDTLKELRDLYQALQWPAPAHPLTDMHDWGDRLVALGFADPVLDMERITLTFETPERLLQELRELGRNLHPQRFAALRGRQWRGQLIDALAQRPLQLTFEVIYGHAIKPAPRLTVAPQQEISLAQMRTALAQGRSAGRASAKPES
ncbi:MAG: biotin synthase [Rhodoferax sp.]|nr:biotin synthase [Rhodoferax sp.]